MAVGPLADVAAATPVSQAGGRVDLPLSGDGLRGRNTRPRHLSPELEALMLCALAVRAPVDEVRLAEVFAGGFDWRRFWDAAATQQVQPLVARELAGARLRGIVPSDLARAAREARVATAGYNLAVHAELQRIGRALRSRGIDVAPLKGTHVALRLFGALDARRVGDIDILVPEERLRDARVALLDLGYDRLSGASVGKEEHSFHGVPYVRTGANCSFVVELHWGLNNPRFVSIDYGALWRRIREAAAPSEDLMAMPSEETLLFLALHLPKHDLGALRLLADIDRLLRVEGDRIDWEHALATASRWRVSHFLYFALHRARATLESPVPDAVMRRLRPRGWRRAAVELLAPATSLLSPPAEEHLRYNRFRLAYCAMVAPATAALRTYFYYLYADYERAPAGVVAQTRGLGQRLARGAAWTALSIGSALAETVRHPSDRARLDPR